MDEKSDLELSKLRAEISHISMHTRKLQTEIRKLERERLMYPFVVVSGVMAALVTVLKVFS
ncbi:MAG: hypothetical protein AAF701_01060 [Pseudomonadota bacterium]